MEQRTRRLWTCEDNQEQSEWLHIFSTVSSLPIRDRFAGKTMADIATEKLVGITSAEGEKLTHPSFTGLEESLRTRRANLMPPSAHSVNDYLCLDSTKSTTRPESALHPLPAPIPFAENLEILVRERDRYVDDIVSKEHRMLVEGPVMKMRDYQVAFGGSNVRNIVDELDRRTMRPRYIPDAISPDQSFYTATEGAQESSFPELQNYFQASNIVSKDDTLAPPLRVPAFGLTPPRLQSPAIFSSFALAPAVDDSEAALSFEEYLKMLGEDSMDAENE